SAGLFDKMVIAGASSITARGLIERAGGVQVLWSRWFLAYLPCSLMTIFIAWRLMLWFFPPEKPELSGGEHYVRGEIEKMGSWTPFVYHFFLASEISMLGTSMPLLMNFAKAHNFNPLLLGMIWSFAAGGKIFVNQSAVMTVGYSYGYFEARDLLRIGFALTVIE